mgnify:CR=1 FL=1
MLYQTYSDAIWIFDEYLPANSCRGNFSNHFTIKSFYLIQYFIQIINIGSDRI